MTALSKVDYHQLHAHLERLMFGGRPMNAEEQVACRELRDKVARCAAEAATEAQRGKLILSWRIPGDLAPTMNTWGNLDLFRKKRIRTELEDRLRALFAQWPDADLTGRKVRRWVRFTRFTTRPSLVDEGAVDSIGGKMVLDAMVRVGVLAGDSPAYVRREALVRATKPGNTHALVELFCVDTEEVPCPDPVDAIVEQIVRKRGKVTVSIVGEENAVVKPKRRAFGRRQFAKKAATAGGGT